MKTREVKIRMEKEVNPILPDQDDDESEDEDFEAEDSPSDDDASESSASELGS